MADARVVVEHEVGLHARPAATFVNTAKGYDCEISITNLTRGTAPANAKSLVQVFKAAVAQGHEIEIVTDGSDADEALATLVGLIESNFGE